MRTRLIFSVVVTGWFAACSNAASTPPSGSVIRRDKNGVMFSVDMAMKITEVEKERDGGLKITATGVLEGKTVALALVVPNKWDVTPMERNDGKSQRQFLPTLVRVGEPSEALDSIFRTLFKLKETETVFKPSGYRAVTLAAREQLEHAEVKIGVGDHGIEGDAEWHFDIDLDLPNKTMRLNVREINR